MADRTHIYPSMAGAPYQGIDFPIGYPATGFQPPPAGLTTLNFTASSAQTVALPAPAGTAVLGIRIDVLNLATETLNVKVTTDGTNYSEQLPLQVLSSGALQATTALGNGSYVVPNLSQPIGIQFTKSAAVDRAFVAVSWITVPNA